MSLMKIPNSCYVILCFVFCIASITQAQDNASYYDNEQIDHLIDKLYSAENFQTRLAHALDNHPTFLEHYDKPAFAEALTNTITESALSSYYDVLKNSLEEKFTEVQIDSLIAGLDSPYGDLFIQAFELDNAVIENSVSLYVNYVIDQNIHLADPTNLTETENTLSLEEYLIDIHAFQEELNAEYANPDTPPLDEKSIAKFTEIGGHQFFPVNPKFRIEATFEKYENPEQIAFKTSTTRMAEYNVYGKASFVIDDKSLELLVYQSIRMMQDPIYKNYLFVPYTDLSSGEETYGGGRYIDVMIPSDPSTIIIDFNKSYQPYCAYTDGFSCPVPPVENALDVKIEAGVMSIDIGYH